MQDNMLKTASAQRYALRAEFEEQIRLVAERLHPDERVRPLAFWTLPRDRRLPYALLSMSLQQLLDASFHDLLATPGIGPKKMESLLMLLQRALDNQPSLQAIRSTKAGILSSCDLSTGSATRRSSYEFQAALVQAAEASRAYDGVAGQASSLAASTPPPSLDVSFDALAVSESQWEACRQTVLRHQLEHETLGKLAPSLRGLPTVIWKRSIKTYLTLSLTEMRALKTHGEKRVGSVLEVFMTIHQLLMNVVAHPLYTLRIQPRFVGPVDQWLRGRLVEPGWTPHLQDLRQQLALPLLNQIAHDAGETVHRLACGRLGIETEPEQVRDLAAGLGVSRARIYQLLMMCTQIMEVRWPEGRWMTGELVRRYRSIQVDDGCAHFCETLRHLLFSDRQLASFPVVKSTTHVGPT
jgi:hypothetical protein